MTNVFEIKVLFGGLMKANKRDKTTGAKLAEEYAKLTILDIDEENVLVKTNDFYITIEDYEKYKALKLELLKPCIACIEFSATSNFSKLKDLKKIDIKKI